MKMRLFPKLFLFTFGMMLLITVLAHLLIFFIAPSQNVLITSTSITNVGAVALSEIDMPQLITDTIIKTFPISLICCIVISLIFSYIFSKGITRPILSTLKTIKQMANMDIKAQCKVKSSDEIGFLATNINALYQSLLITIHNLEQEKEKVSLAEREKLNFLRSASHELKTPVTELNATLENMILGIGEYSDYETYLPKCKGITEQLGIMIKDILNTSRLQMETNNEKSEEIVLQEFILDICEPYKLIAQARGIQFHAIISGKTIVIAPAQLLKKAISNLLSNAVNYTNAGKNIFVTLHSDILTVNNECTPLPDEQLQHIFEPFYRPDYSRNQNTGGNGFGLYVVDTILRKLKLSYRFIPMEDTDGMSFIIQF